MQRRLYLDSSVVIYLVENTAKKGPVLSVLSGYQNYALCSSYLALMECLVKPLQNSNLSLVSAYEAYFQTLILISSPRKAFRLAAEIRAYTNLRTPDALHLAYAAAGRCEVFLTGDRRLASAWQQNPLYPFPQGVIVV